MHLRKLKEVTDTGAASDSFSRNRNCIVHHGFVVVS